MKTFWLLEHPIKGQQIIKSGFSWGAFFFNWIFFLYNKCYKIAGVQIIVMAGTIPLFQSLKEDAAKLYVFRDDGVRYAKDYETKRINEARDASFSDRKDLINQGHSSISANIAVIEKRTEIYERLGQKVRRAEDTAREKFYADKAWVFNLSEAVIILLLWLGFALFQSVFLRKAYISRGFEEKFSTRANNKDHFLSLFSTPPSLSSSDSTQEYISENKKENSSNIGLVITENSPVKQKVVNPTRGKRSIFEGDSKSGDSYVPVIISISLIFGVSLIIFLLMFFNNKDEVQEVRLEVPQQKVTTSTYANKEVSLSNTEPNNEDRFKLTIILEGDVEKLIVCDEGEVPPVFHEFDNLKSGWFQDIKFSKSFRCYSSKLQNLSLSINRGNFMKIQGSGAGSFSWRPNSKKITFASNEESHKSSTFDSNFERANDGDQRNLRDSVSVPMLIPCEACEQQVSKVTSQCFKCGHPISNSIEAFRESFIRTEEIRNVEKQMNAKDFIKKARFLVGKLGLNNIEPILNATEANLLIPKVGLQRLFDEGGMPLYLNGLESIRCDKDYTGWAKLTIDENLTSFGWLEGEIWLLAQIKNGKRDGFVFTWYPQGKLRSQQEFKDGRREGLRISWTMNGTLEEVEEYKNDLKLESKKDFKSIMERKAKSVQPVKRTPLTNRDKELAFKDWQKKVVYVTETLGFGNRNQINQAIDVQSELTEEDLANFANSKELKNYKEAYEFIEVPKNFNGWVKLVASETLVNLDNFKRGHVWLLANIYNGSKNGYEFTWHGNGRIRSQTFYNHGRKEGPRILWNADGQKEIVNYENGHRVREK
jgi:antitoxin component YwqK of YwqJK toxin-antitoxin module